MAEMTREAMDYDVVIVGAGAVGLRAAKLLNDEGCEVTVSGIPASRFGDKPYRRARGLDVAEKRDMKTVEPEDVMQVLHEYHEAMGDLIHRFEGTLERFTGDGLMVFFNDPIPVPDAADRAVRMAVAMRGRVTQLAEEWHRRGFDLHAGFGVAQGHATLGRIGFEGRSDYAAIGSVTNLAARLCSHAQQDQILITQRVHSGAQDHVVSDPLGEVGLRGFLRPVTLAWCPDSRCIVLTDASSPDRGQPDALFVVWIESRERQQLTTPTASMMADNDPAISPDGKLLAYSVWNENDKPEHFEHQIISLETGRQVRSFEIPSTAFRGSGNILLRWMPDGSGLTFIDYRQGAANICFVPFAGGPPVQLTNFSDSQIFWFDWSRNGRQLAVTRGMILNDVILIKNLQNFQ